MFYLWQLAMFNCKTMEKVCGNNLSQETKMNTKGMRVIILEETSNFNYIYLFTKVNLSTSIKNCKGNP